MAPRTRIGFTTINLTFLALLATLAGPGLAAADGGKHGYVVLDRRLFSDMAAEGTKNLDPLTAICGSEGIGEYYLRFLLLGGVRPEGVPDAPAGGRPIDSAWLMDWLRFAEKHEARVTDYTRFLFTLPVMQAKVAQIQETIARKLLSTGGIDQALKLKMIKNLKGVRLVNASIILHEPAGTARDQMALSYAAVCGPALTEVNAFYASIEDAAGLKDEYMIVCPAYYAYVAWRGYPVEALDSTLGHELGHSIDAAVHTVLGTLEEVNFAPFYANMNRCAGENFPAAFVKAPDDKQRAGLIKAWVRQPEPQDAYMREISADSWGLRVLEEEAGAHTDPFTQMNWLRGNLSIFCDLHEGGSDGLHPPNTYRVGQAAANPVIRAGLEKANHWTFRPSVYCGN